MKYAFLQLNPCLIAAVMVVIFLHLIETGYATYLSFYNRGKKLLTLALCADFVILFFALALIRENAFSLICAEHLHRQNDFILNMKALSIILYISASIVMVTISIARITAYERRTINHKSIRESADAMSLGMCFFNTDGQIYLLNKKMNEHIIEIAGKVVSDGNEIWKIIREYARDDKVRAVEDDNLALISMNDGGIYFFKREMLEVDGEKVIEVLSYDVSETYEVYQKIAKENIELRELQNQLKRYSQMVEIVTKKKEYLEIKSRIHDSFGQNINLTKRYIGSLKGNVESKDKCKDDEMLKEIKDCWRKTIWLIQNPEKKLWTDRDENSFELLFETAESVGVNLKIKGEIPKERKIEDIITLCGAEALCNAVKHADAKELRISIDVRKNYYIIKYANDVSRHKQDMKVKPSGGIKNIKERVSECGGTAKIEMDDEFRLILAIPRFSRKETMFNVSEK